VWGFDLGRADGYALEYEVLLREDVVVASWRGYRRIDPGGSSNEAMQRSRLAAGRWFGASSPSTSRPHDKIARTTMTVEERDYHELCYYTLAHGDPSFIHQHVVDAFAAQNSGEHDKPIRLTFALVGLYLHVERGLSGRQVQRAHM